ncbi:hypothetical protein DEIPH_ctg064orf0054 [Deinococcus phoenicis]|uniref:Uncharacterized protein n=1 Tax=Deinococcus phoenicis TaxID=1476583 RepID=A0A016QL45_9DEIO|nr:hypothetical protein [Deinococcus phoenicis]EYB66885.1 hypothetical protein DEIPH_ctg064orf0054 [Deinococcus phoenicis]
MSRLLLALALTALPLGAHAAPTTADPWPASPVLVRLFILPSGRADGAALTRALALTPFQVAGLRRLAQREAAYGEAGRHVIGRQEAASLNARIAAMRVEKDRKVRVLLGAKYPAFRHWVGVWWARQVKAAQ